MGCEECIVVDENIIIRSITISGSEMQFIVSFLEGSHRFCLSKKLKEKYAKKLKIFRERKDLEIIDMMLFRDIACALFRDAAFSLCPEEACDEEFESDPKFSTIPRKDRFLLLISEFFDTYIVSEDGPLINAVNSSDLKTECLCSRDALVRIRI
jgi:hypothetical protein